MCTNNMAIGVTCATFALSIGMSSSLMTEGSSTFFDIIKTNKSIDLSIVETSFKAASIFDCLSRGLQSSVSSVKSFYFEESTGMCYHNNDVDDTITLDVSDGTMYYCRVEGYQQTDAMSTSLITTTHTASVNRTSCVDLYDAGFTVSGVYYISDPTNTSNPIEVLCRDGWIVFQRRIDGKEDFYRGWNDYVNGFGNPTGEYWLGLERLHQWTSAGLCELFIYLRAEAGSTGKDEGYARYSNFRIDGPSTDYVLQVSGFSGDVADDLLYHNGRAFSTFDNDNDDFIANCVDMYKGAWWHGSCHASNLNGLYLNGSHASFGDGIEWSGTWTQYYSLIETEMRFKCN